MCSRWRSRSVLQPDPAPQVFVQGFITIRDAHKVLLVNKRETAFTVKVPGAMHGTLELVDQATAASATKRPISSDTLKLLPLGRSRDIAAMIGFTPVRPIPIDALEIAR
ncbi:MAG TPA: hypothetical protein VII70_01260 [Steroidobacteraceae bacterium]